MCPGVVTHYDNVPDCDNYTGPAGKCFAILLPAIKWHTTVPFIIFRNIIIIIITISTTHKRT